MALIVSLLLLVASGSARAADESGVATRPIGSLATQQTGVGDRQPGTNAALTGHRQSPTADTSSRTPDHVRVAPVKRAQRRVTSLGFQKVLGLYLVSGLMLGVLPVSLPMALILSALVVNAGPRITASRAFMFALCYVTGTATVYTALGLSAASYQHALGSFLRSPLWLILFAVLLIGFAIRLMAGELVQLPPRWQRALAAAPVHTRKAIQYLIIAGVGTLWALSVSADVATRLASYLAIRVHMDGGVVVVLALLTMSFGLGLPLLAVGTGITTVVRRAGSWMEGVKVFFAIELLATALLIVWPSLDGGLRVAAGWLWLLVVIAARHVLFPRQARNNLAQTG
ncbi:hypothetical protein [Paraburkholderia sp. GAS334]|uniref:cytochrome c biogenesis protein CcdA n=1 Tax=Paraburkholderia sp. GAS334 TaxID=3035131 RepID=UPI003D1B2CE6